MKLTFFRIAILAMLLPLAVPACSNTVAGIPTANATTPAVTQSCARQLGVTRVISTQGGWVCCSEAATTCTILAPQPPKGPGNIGGGGGGGITPPDGCTKARCSGDGDDVATVDPAVDATCDGSPGHLGTSNLASESGPVQSDKNCTITDIFGLKPNPATNTAYAWVYTTHDGHIFIQYNPAVGGSAAAAWLGNVLGGVPFAGPTLTATITSIVNSAANPKEISSQAWSAIQQSIRAHHGANAATIHACFTGPLALG